MQEINEFKQEIRKNLIFMKLNNSSLYKKRIDEFAVFLDNHDIQKTETNLEILKNAPEITKLKFITALMANVLFDIDTDNFHNTILITEFFLS